MPPGKGFNFVTGIVQVPAGHLRMVYNKAGYYPACNKNLTDIHRLSGKLKPFKSGNAQYLSDLAGFGAHCARVLAGQLRLDFNRTDYKPASSEDHLDIGQLSGKLQSFSSGKPI